MATVTRFSGTTVSTFIEEEAPKTLVGQDDTPLLGEPINEFHSPRRYSYIGSKSNASGSTMETHSNIKSLDENETHLNTSQSQSSSRKTLIGRIIDERLLKQKELRALTLENFQKIEREKKRLKKELKRQRLEENIKLEEEVEQLESKTEKDKQQEMPQDLEKGDLSFVLDAKHSSYLNDAQMLAALESSSITSSSIEEEDSEFGTVSAKEQFLEEFPKLPDISKISSEASSIFDIKRKHRNAEIHENLFDPDLLGKFVNPLTGETETESSSDKPDSVHPEVEENIGEEIESETLDLDLPEYDDDDDNIIHHDKEIVFLNEIEIEAIDTPPEGKNYRSMSTLHFQISQTDSINMVKEFLDNIVEQVVTNLEIRDQLTSKLDKTKLLNELIEVMATYNMEKTRNTKLNAKAVEYYRRTNKFWGLSKLPLNVELLEFGRYQQSLNLLDNLKERVVATKNKTLYYLDSVYAEMESVQIHCTALTDKLEHRMLKTVANLNSEFLSRSMETNLQLMQELRLEIGESRMELITKRDTLARLQEQMIDYEHITQDLTMTHYLAVQQDVLKMGKILEGRTITFDHMHERCDNYLKRVAFYREKRDITAALLNNEKERLEDLLTKREELRDQLMELNLISSRNKIQKHKLYLKAGILYKPALMFDFDKCTELVVEKRKIVSELRRRMEKLDNRLTIISERVQSVC